MKSIRKRKTNVIAERIYMGSRKTVLVPICRSGRDADTENKLVDKVCEGRTKVGQTEGGAVPYAHRHVENRELAGRRREASGASRRGAPW